jgi:hypothetical protein
MPISSNPDFSARTRTINVRQVRLRRRTCPKIRLAKNSLFAPALAGWQNGQRIEA